MVAIVEYEAYEETPTKNLQAFFRLISLDLVVTFFTPAIGLSLIYSNKGRVTFGVFNNDRFADTSNKYQDTWY